MKKLIVFALTFVCVHVSAQQPVNNFQLTDVSTGATVSLDQYTGKPVVVIFTSNDCPYDNYYASRFAALIGDYGNRAAFLFINAHLDPQEGDESMKKKASTWSFRVPYLSDKSQLAMEALGARRSPEVFLLKSANNGHTIFYSGAIDDNPQDEGAVTSRYLREALESLLAGKPAVAPVRSAGCSIRRK